MSDLLFTAFRVALGALRRSPLRAVLTAFGVLVGVAAVTVVVALGEGASLAVSGTIDSLGTNRITIRARPAARSGLRDAAVPVPLTDADAKALAEEVSSIEWAAPWLRTAAQVAYRDRNIGTSIIGTTLEFFRIRDWKPASGALWSARGEREKQRFCLLGRTAQRELFGGIDPIGKTIRIGRQPFVVVGVLEEKGQSPTGSDQDDLVVMPIGAYRSKVQRTRPGQVEAILASATSPEAVGRAERQATALLRQRHGLAEGAPSDFRIRTQEEYRRTQEQILGTLRLLLLCIAAVSLVVGGIGVMNIMLISVAERTREIGIRMAIGAREAHILAQFLVEAVVLSLVGGLGGALAAAIGIYALGDALELPLSFSGDALTIACATSTAVGLFFGFVPARRAARLDPTEALGRE